MAKTKASKINKALGIGGRPDIVVLETIEQQNVEIQTNLNNLRKVQAEIVKKGLTVDLVGKLAEATSSLKEATSTASKEVFSDENIKKAQTDQTTASKMKNFQYTSLLEAEEINELADSTLKTLEAQKDLSEKIADDLTGKLMGGFETFLDKMPGGGFLSNALGLDKVAEGLKKSFTQTLLNTNLLTGSFKGSIIPAMKNIFTKIKTEGKDIITKVFNSPLLRTVVIVGLVTTALVMAFNKLKEMQEISEKVIKSTGLTANNYERIRRDSIVIQKSSGALGLTLEEVSASSEALIKNFGSVNAVSAKMVQGAASLEASYGISSDSTAKLYKNLENIAGLDTASVTNMSAKMAQGAEQMGININEMFEDMANNTEKLSLYFSKYDRSIGSAILKINKLGLSIEKVAKISETLLDFESSITQEMEASVLLGRQLDFGMARELIMKGDTVKAMEEITKQMGTQADFDKLNLYQKQAIAKSVGMTVGEFNETLQKQQAIGKMTEDQRKEYEKIEKSLEDANSINSDNLLKQREQEYAISRMSRAWDGITAGLSKILYPALLVIGKILEGITWLVEGIANLFNTDIKAGGESIGTWIFGVLTAIPLVILFVKVLSKGLKGLFTSTGEGLKTVANSAAESSEAIGKTVENIGKSVGETSKGLFKSMGQGIASFMRSVSSALVGFGQAIGQFMNGLAAGSAGIPVLLTIAATIVAIGLALYLATPFVKAFGEIILGVFSALPGIIGAVATGISTVLSVITLEKAAAVVVMALAFGQLATTIMALSVAMTVLSVASLLPGVSSIFGIGSNGSENKSSELSKSKSNQQESIADIMDKKLDLFIKAVNELKIEVILDGKKVGKGIASIQPAYKQG